MSTTETGPQTTTTDESITTRLDQIETELAELREYVERIDQTAVNESTVNVLLSALADDVDFEVDPGQNRAALTTVADRLDELETAVELLQHESAEVER